MFPGNILKKIHIFQDLTDKASLLFRYFLFQKQFIPAFSSFCLMNFDGFCICCKFTASAVIFLRFWNYGKNQLFLYLFLRKKMYLKYAAVGLRRSGRKDLKKSIE